MKKIKNLLLFFVSLVIVASCSYTEEITFNKNFSGQMKQTFDYSFFMALGSDSTTNAEDLDLTKSFDTLKNELSAIKGISDVSYEYDPAGAITITYNFKNIKALNRALSNDKMMSDEVGEMGFSGSRKFTKKGRKKLYLDFKPVMDDSLAQTADEMFNYNFILNMPREILRMDGCDSAKPGCDSLKYSKNVVSYYGSANTFFAGEKPTTLSFKLGKKVKN